MEEPWSMFGITTKLLFLYALYGKLTAGQNLIGADDDQGGAYMVPMYHVPMLNDAVRNNAFYEALRRVVTPESVVVDLGAGSGLLSLMAARLGAEKVFAVERKGFCDSVTREIVEINKLTDKIELICDDAKFVSSADLQTVSGKSPTILVSETLDSYLIGEGWLRYLDDWNVRKVLHPDAIVIPHHATLYMHLCQTHFLLNETKTVSGFNFAPIDRFRPKNEVIVGTVRPSTHLNLSMAFPIIDFNFSDRSAGDFFHYLYLEIPIIEDGLLGGAVYSFDLSLDKDEEIKINTFVGSTTHWQQLTQIFDWYKPVRRGDTVRLQIGQLPERIVVVDADESVLIRFNNAGEIEVQVYASKAGETACSMDEESDVFTFSGGGGEYNLWPGFVGQIFMFRFPGRSGAVTSMVVPPALNNGRDLFVYDVAPPEVKAKADKPRN